MRRPVHIRDATPADLAYLIGNIRHEDADELVMAGVSNVTEAIVDSFRHSIVCLAMTAGADLLCLFGVTQPMSLPADQGVIWELGTPAIRRHAAAFIENTPLALDNLLSLTPHIQTYTNAMPEHYSTYRKWAMRYAQAKFDSDQVASGTGIPFVRFTIQRKRGG